MAARTHAGHIENINLLDHLAPIFAEAMGQNRHHQLEHRRLDGFQLLIAAAAAGMVFEGVPAFVLGETEVGPIDAHHRRDAAIAALMELSPLAIEQEADSSPMGENGRIMLIGMDLGEEVVDADEELSESRPVVPE